MVKYYAFNGQRVAMKVGGTLTYLHGDHLGSTVMETNNLGATTTDEKYFAYGKQRDSGKVGTDNRFTGHPSATLRNRKEDGSGLMYYSARFFDPQTGMFVSPDTLVPDAGLVIDYNRFAYARGNAMKYNDPTGHIVTGDCMCGGNGDPFAEAESQLAGGSSGSTSSGGGGGSGSGGAGVATTILTGAAEAACENDGDCTNEVSTVSDTISKGLDTAQQIVETNGGSLQIIGEASSYSTSELRAAQYVADLGNEVILRPAENILNQRTSDLLVNGMSYDVYTPITTNANRIISAIASKGSQAQGIVLDLTQTTVKLKDLGNILARVQGAGAKGITDIIVIGGD